MAGVKISALPAIPSCALTDLIAEVQPATGGTTYKATLQQVLTLFNSNIQIAESQVTNLVADLASKLNLSGGTMTGTLDMGSHFITNLLDPVNPQDAATKNYADSIASGFTIQPACRVATTAALTATYANGASGVGATLTNSGAMAALSIDGVALNVADRVLVKNQGTTFQNGIYVVTAVGSGIANWVLTRATDYDQPAEVNPGDLVVINEGTVNTQTSWVETATVATIGTDPILFSQFTANPATFLKVANNLSELTATAATARTNIVAAKSGANSDITSLTGLTGVLQAPTGIYSSAGVAALTFTYTASAVNNLRIFNNTAGNAPDIIAEGSDAAIGIVLSPKNGFVQILDYTGTIGGKLCFSNATNTFHTFLQVAAAQATTVTFTLPAADGVAGTVMTSNGAGVLSMQLTKCVQQVYQVLASVATGTTIIPMDDTIPQNTEGNQYLTVSITPKNANNILRFDVLVHVAHSAGTAMTAAIFQGSTANAIVAGSNWAPAVNILTQIKVVHEVVAGTTSATTFNVRAGCTNVGTTTFNGTGGARLLGGVLASSIVITEYTP